MTGILFYSRDSGEAGRRICHPRLGPRATDNFSRPPRIPQVKCITCHPCDRCIIFSYIILKSIIIGNVSNKGFSQYLKRLKKFAHFPIDFRNNRMSIVTDILFQTIKSYCKRVCLRVKQSFIYNS